VSEAVEVDSFARASLGGVRSSSARALLLVVLGEFVWPRKRPVWSSTLGRALADLDVEPNAARKALQRTAQTGITEIDRNGRRARWSVTSEGNCMLVAGHERMWAWENRDTAWDRRWLVLSVTVPESQRRLRHHLQSRLAWAGMGTLQPPASG
jgi:phenylacetic acid degradation operon negative regulatory protein